MRISLLIAIAAGLFVWLTGGQMPNEVASHFDASGNADGFVARDSYLILMVTVIAFTTLFVGGIGTFLPSLPDDLINLPNKSYWLAAERKADSLRYVSRWLQVSAAAIAVFLCYVHWLVLQANATDAKQLDSSFLYAGIGLLLAGTVWGLVSLFKRFRKPAM